MSKRKYLLSAARLVVPTIGLSLICGGAYIKSIQSEQLLLWRDISTYLFIILGFILLVIGVLWSVGHGMKSVLLKRSERRSQDTDVQVFTVDRSVFYPPSYEESLVRNGAIEGISNINPLPTGMQWPSPAPPVYTQSCYETFNEDLSHEDPPTYQQAVLQSLADAQAAHLPTNSSAEPL